MADNQRIHPDIEAPPRPSAPLVPRNIAKSENGDPNNRPLPPPLPQRTLPVMHSKPPRRRRSCCCRFLCCTFTTLLILIIAIAITAGILFLAFRPKIPKYSVDKLRITEFNFSSGTNILSVTSNVRITARNPNKKIGIYYEGGSHISAWYSGAQLCEGSMIKFYQGHKNTTVLDLPLRGQIQDASGLVSKIQQQIQDTNNIPLDIKVKQPVRVKFGKLKLFKVNFRVRCKLVVNSLSANNDIKISSSSYLINNSLRG
ncbi:uncharacterized protein DS421_1g06540 [Arachis hypogaea]|nr:uncharacterized protein DS421_1g06540 [Arachis hypogaea]